MEFFPNGLPEKKEFLIDMSSLSSLISQAITSGVARGSLRAIDLANITTKALGHHVEACFAAHLPQGDPGQGAPDAQEFIAKTT